MKKELRNKKGITLIALVITIIVLLILAGVSITMISSQDGILKKATGAKEVTERAKVEEIVSLAYNTAIMDPDVDDDKIIAGIEKELRAQGYILQKESATQKTLQGMTVGQETFEMKEAATPLEINVTLTYSETVNNKYYVPINGKSYEMILNENGVEISKNEKGTGTESGNEDTIEISGNDTDIITASITKNTETSYTLTITPISKGNSSITVTAKGTSISKTLNITVKESIVLELSGTGTSSDPYQIANKENWEYLAEKVNAGMKCTNIYFAITGEIDLNGNTLISIGNSEENYFDGIVDGCNRTIQNGSIPDGLFGYTGTNFIISTLVLENCSSQPTSSPYENLGLLARYNKGTINNCRARFSSVTASINVGGLVGYNAGTLDNCTMEDGSVTANSTYAGGLVGYNIGSITFSTVKGSTINAIGGGAGGLIGYNKGTYDNNNCVVNNNTLEGEPPQGEYVGNF